jgi:hypothetical protein
MVILFLIKITEKYDYSITQCEGLYFTVDV